MKKSSRDTMMFLWWLTVKKESNFVPSNQVPSLLMETDASSLIPLLSGERETPLRSIQERYMKHILSDHGSLLTSPGHPFHGMASGQFCGCSAFEEDVKRLKQDYENLKCRK